MGKYQLDQYGRAYCKIAIKPKESQSMMAISFKVDTGADFTTIQKVSFINLDTTMSG
jgi:hypothetical protein